MMVRANTKLGTDITLHDLRHTYAMRLAGDRNLLVTDVQALLRHKSLTTTQVYPRARADEVIERVREHYAREPEPPAPSLNYDPTDLAVLFGAGSQMRNAAGDLWARRHRRTRTGVCVGSG
jgi:hypothetical protein